MAQTVNKKPNASPCEAAAGAAPCSYAAGQLLGDYGETRREEHGYHPPQASECGPKFPPARKRRGPSHESETSIGQEGDTNS
jgi:hypothetical protein